MLIRKAVIPAAGFGTRMYPAAFAIPKEMLPLGRVPVLHHIVAELAAAGVRQVAVITRPGKRVMEDHFKAAREAGDLPHDLEMIYLNQATPGGVADAIEHAREFCEDEPFFTALGDAVLWEPECGGVLRRMADAFAENKVDAVIALHHVPRERISRFGVADVHEDQNYGEGILRIKSFVEKPKPEEAPSDLAIAARYLFSSSFFSVMSNMLKGSSGEILTPDIITHLAQFGRGALGCVLSNGERRYDIGNHGSYFQAFADFALRDSEHGASFATYLEKRLENC